MKFKDFDLSKFPVPGGNNTELPIKVGVSLAGSFIDGLGSVGSSRIQEIIP
ncbi:uncharacterized protein G2W53_031171 [Senna tora]|uniref:Uncharacterized protein n=1 Tax=Senna tora TaxID=362788 RepID=A0A834TAB2_9FABA|nr:uncharacterized protein G2W53_031171 [Senna tora]